MMPWFPVIPGTLDTIEEWLDGLRADDVGISKFWIEKSGFVGIPMPFPMYEEMEQNILDVLSGSGSRVVLYPLGIGGEETYAQIHESTSPEIGDLEYVPRDILPYARLVFPIDKTCVLFCSPDDYCIMGTPANQMSKLNQSPNEFVKLFRDYTSRPGLEYLSSVFNVFFGGEKAN